MEHQKQMMHTVPHYLEHFPRKARSQIIQRGPKRCLDFDDTSLSHKRRIVMLNETDMVSVELNVTGNSSRVEDDGKENRMMILGSQKTEEPPLDKDISTPRKRKGKRTREVTLVDTIEVVGPKTPSPEKRKRVRGLTKKNEKKRLVHVSEKVERAHYYTRALNNFVVTALEHEKEPISQPTIDITNQQPKTVDHLVDNKIVSVKGLKRKIKKIQLGPFIQRDEFKTWRVLLSEGRAKSMGSPRNKDNGICREVYFIYKVGYIQGSRVHLPWKGSVLDSVIGALLTQRVDDKYSSSAFMSLGTTFPQYSDCHLYSRHHRIMRAKRSMARSTRQISAQEYTLNFLKKQENVSKLRKQSKTLFDEMNKGKSMKIKVLKKEKPKPDRNDFMKESCIGDRELEREADKIDSVDWHAVMRANVDDIAEAILYRGMNKKLAIRIKDFLNRLVLDHGNLDLEWLRKADSQKAKDFLLSINGIGIKSTECVRLLALRQPAFPVDINVARVTVRLGWVPAPSISDDIQMFLLDQSSKLHDLIHQYLWLRLSNLDIETLHQLHCHMITFGKVFCTKQKPNCAQCPMRLECRYYSNLAVRSSSSIKEIDIEDLGDPRLAMIEAEPAMSVRESERKKCKVKEAPIVVLPDDCIEAPKTPVKVPLSRSQSITSKKRTSVKMTQLGRFKTSTEHFIYELPDLHPILETFDDRDPDDLSPYLLITWETDLKKTGESSAKKSPSTSCVKGSRIVPGTIMIPCRTALRGSFPLNATYFQPNEVFADQQTNQIPVDFPRRQLRGLPRKTLYCGNNLMGIVKGRSAIEIRRLFHEGMFLLYMYPNF